MRKIERFFGLLILLSLTAVFSCKDHDTKNSGEFSSGVIVVNEGNYGSSDGTLSHFNPATSDVKQDIYGLKNAGKALGDVVQSMIVEGDKGYIVIDNDNKVIVVNANTMELVQTISGFGLPRYMVVYNGKGYVTEWVSFSDAGRISIVNLSTNEVEGTIAVGYGAENIVVVNDKLYVSNSFEGTVSVVDPVSKAVVKTIDVATSPGGFAVDKNGILWVICGGGYDIDSNPLNDGAFAKIDVSTNTVLSTIPLNKTISAKLAINKAADVLYYFTGPEVYKLPIGASSASAAIISESAAVGFYGIGVDPDDDVIYVGDAMGFVTNGTVFRYDASGTAKGSFAAGRAPNGFVFR